MPTVPQRHGRTYVQTDGNKATIVIQYYLVRRRLSIDHKICDLERPWMATKIFNLRPSNGPYRLPLQRYYHFTRLADYDRGWLITVLQFYGLLPDSNKIHSFIHSVFTSHIMLFISDNCRLHVGQVVIRDKLIISYPRLSAKAL